MAGDLVAAFRSPYLFVTSDRVSGLLSDPAQPVERHLAPALAVARARRGPTHVTVRPSAVRASCHDRISVIPPRGTSSSNSSNRRLGSRNRPSGGNAAPLLFWRNECRSTVGC
jgi:hypothetical protein